MKKFKIIILTIVLLWLAAYLSSLIIGDEFNGEIVSEGIAIIPIYGTITLSDSQDLFGTSSLGSDSIIENLKKAENNDGIKAVILEINSPGGTVVASKEVADYVKELKTKKPVVAWIREVGASGAYWIASSSNLIVADEASITGSVGVISSYLQFSDLLDEYGVKYERLVAGKYKDAGSPFKDLETDERILMQSKLDIIHEIFLKDVIANRNLNNNQVNDVRTGFFFLGIEAKELGLVDELGGKELAVEKAKELGDISSDGKIVEYKVKKNIFDLIQEFSNKVFFSMGKGIGNSLVEKEEGIQILAL